MEFCSPKAWIYDSSDEEYISASEMLEGISPSDACTRNPRFDLVYVVRLITCTGLFHYENTQGITYLF